MFYPIFVVYCAFLWGSFLWAILGGSSTPFSIGVGIFLAICLACIVYTIVYYLWAWLQGWSVR